MRCSLGTQGGSAPSGITCIEIATLSQLVRLLFYAKKHPVTWGAKEGAVIAENLLQNANRRFINAAMPRLRTVEILTELRVVLSSPRSKDQRNDVEGKDGILHRERGSRNGSRSEDRQTDSPPFLPPSAAR